MNSKAKLFSLDNIVDTTTWSSKEKIHSKLYHMGRRMRTAKQSLVCVSVLDR